MCGITGIISPNTSDLETAITQMNACVKHRGPDDAGIYVTENVALGHTRLSIIDLSAAGHQPMHYTSPEGRTATLVFNGEIYNYQELKADLKEKGYTFQSNSDSEALLACYLEYGKECVTYLKGMFAFAIHDPQTNTVFAARDRFGQKPFKYYTDGERFLFSSELKSILSQDIPRDIDHQAIYDFLTLQYVPAPRTGFKNIWKLPPAHTLTIDTESLEYSIEQYFDLNFSDKKTFSTEEWNTHLEELITTSVKRRLISDAPLGAFLSGGVDSSGIVALMAQNTESVKTFSIAFDHKDFDESSYAKEVADQYQTEHTEFQVSSDDLPQYIETLAQQFEEPFADPSQLPTYILSKLTRQHVTVALSGDAGDENFGGYQVFQAHLASQRFAPLLHLLHPIRDLLPVADTTKKLIELVKVSPARRQYNFTTYFSETEKRELLRPEIIRKIDIEHNLFEETSQEKQFPTVLDESMYLYFTYYIPDDINVKMDMSSMAHALEVRAPLLDHELVERTSQMPAKEKVTLRETKKPFKQLLEKHLSSNILYRKKKGFSVPLKHWFRNELYDYMKERVLDPNGLAYTLFYQKDLEDLIHEHYTGKKDHAKKLWMLLMLNLWYDFYFKDHGYQANIS